MVVVLCDPGSDNETEEVDLSSISGKETWKSGMITAETAGAIQKERKGQRDDFSSYASRFPIVKGFRMF